MGSLIEVEVEVKTTLMESCNKNVAKVCFEMLESLVVLGKFLSVTVVYYIAL